MITDKIRALIIQCDDILRTLEEIEYPDEQDEYVVSGKIAEAKALLTDWLHQREIALVSLRRSITLKSGRE